MLWMNKIPLRSLAMLIPRPNKLSPRSHRPHSITRVKGAKTLAFCKRKRPSGWRAFFITLDFTVLSMTVQGFFPLFFRNSDGMIVGVSLIVWIAEIKSRYRTRSFEPSAPSDSVGLLRSRKVSVSASASISRPWSGTGTRGQNEHLPSSELGISISLSAAAQ